MSADQITPERIGEIRELADYEYEQGQFSSPLKGALDQVFDALESSRSEVQRLTEQVERFKTGAVRVSLDGAVYFEPYVQLLREEITKLREEARRPAAVPERAAWLTIEEMANALVLDFGTPIGAARGFARAIAEASKAKGARLPAAVQGVEVPEKPTPEEWWNMVLERGIGADNSVAMYAHEMGMKDGIAWLRSRLSPSPQPATGAVVASDSWVARFLSLTPEERLFVLRCGVNGSGKYAAGEPYSIPGQGGLWEAPERLGLLVCEGSYKWSAPGFLEGLASLAGLSKKAKSELAILLSKALAAGGEG